MAKQLKEWIHIGRLKAHLRHYHAEIKGILNKSAVISGIGNASRDEILLANGVFALRKRTTLSDNELKRLFRNDHHVSKDAAVELKE